MSKVNRIRNLITRFAHDIKGVAVVYVGPSGGSFFGLGILSIDIDHLDKVLIQRHHAP